MLVQKQPGEILIEEVGFLLVEIASLPSMLRDGVGDAVDELAQGGLASRGAQLAIEVLAGGDVAGFLAPGEGELRVLLLEEEGAGLVVLDPGIHLAPGNRVEGVHSLRAEARAGEGLPAGQALHPIHRGGWGRGPDELGPRGHFLKYAV